MSKEDATMLFEGIVPGDPTEPEAHFNEVSIDALWGHSLVFDLDGESVPLPGPIHVVDRSLVSERERKMRFVEVFFFFYTRAQNYSIQEPHSRLFARAYAWQGDNNLIHLLERMATLKNDPMGSVSDQVEVRTNSLEDRLRDHAAKLEAKISSEEERIHQNNLGMEEPQDTMG